MDWSDSWRGAFRIELRAEAMNLAWRGWPVLPGTYPTGSHWSGRDGVVDEGPVPVHHDWADRIGTKPEQVAAWWTGQRFSLLVATGYVVDAIEVPADLGRRVATVLRATGVPVPIAATPTGQWLFLTESGRELAPELSGRGDIVLHGSNSWIPLPPTPFQHGVVHWRVKPEVCGGTLPASGIVQEALVEATRLPSGQGEQLDEPALAGAQRLVSSDRLS
ncbi:MAG: bifunctional DNA primase/polymerase [Kutzneria sp.]|nr:bifunctional DNA primase/polymerase [Kutzneria sp.]